MTLNIVLYQPEIPHNTGSIARTCALTNTKLHLIKPLGFSVEDKYLKRAGLDYWHLVNIYYYDSLEELYEKNKDANFYYATTHATKFYHQVEYKNNDFIVFGRETQGLPREITENNPNNCIKIPMRVDLERSLNLSNSANIILFEALRQLDFSTI